MRYRLLSLALLVMALVISGAVITGRSNAMEPPQMEIGQAYALATSATQKNGAVFLNITSYSDVDDRLIAAKSDVAERVELHTHMMDGGIMMMRQVDGFDIPAGGTLELKPAGHHIMLIGLREPLKAGESFDLILEFEHDSSAGFSVPVISPGDAP